MSDAGEVSLIERMADEDVQAIIDGCEGAQKGPWEVIPLHPDGHAVVNPAGDAELGNWSVARNVWWKSDADHIARLSPEVVRSLLTELLALRQSSSFTQGYEQGREDAAKVADEAAQDCERAFVGFASSLNASSYMQGRTKSVVAAIRALPIPQAPGEKR